jgi:hypothetical protein
LWYVVYFYVFHVLSMYVVWLILYAFLHHVRHFGQWKLFLNVPYKSILLTYLLSRSLQPGCGPSSEGPLHWEGPYHGVGGWGPWPGA